MIYAVNVVTQKKNRRSKNRGSKNRGSKNHVNPGYLVVLKAMSFGSTKGEENRVEL